MQERLTLSVWFLVLQNLVTGKDGSNILQDVITISRIMTK